MWLLLFVAITLCLVILPLLPSLLELRLATDVRPLKVVQEYDSNIKHFAIGFKIYLEKNFASFFDPLHAPGTGIKEGELRDGTGFQIVGTGGQVSFSAKETASHATARMIIAFTNLVLPADMHFETEIYSARGVLAGDNSHFRAILAEEEIRLGSNCAVMRWIHSNASLHAQSGCQLFGRCSAEESVHLAANTRFERLHAAKVVVGEDTSPALTVSARTLLKELHNVKNQFERRWLVSGNLIVPADSDFSGDIVATGSVTLEDNVRICGSVKSNGELQMGRGCEVEGSIISTTRIHMQPHCRVKGQVIAEESIMIEEGCVLGAERRPITLNAPVIHLSSAGVRIFGTIWAAREGLVLSAPVAHGGPRL